MGVPYFGAQAPLGWDPYKWEEEEQDDPFALLAGLREAPISQAVEAEDDPFLLLAQLRAEPLGGDERLAPVPEEEYLPSTIAREPPPPGPFEDVLTPQFDLPEQPPSLAEHLGVPPDIPGIREALAFGETPTPIYQPQPEPVEPLLAPAPAPRDVTRLAEEPIPAAEPSALGPQEDEVSQQLTAILNQYDEEQARALENPVRNIVRALGRDVGARFALQGAVKFLDLVGGAAGLEAHPVLREIVDTANRQREAEARGDPHLAAELTRGLISLVAEMQLIPGAAAPSRVARFGPRVLAEVATPERQIAAPVLRALGRAPQQVTGSVVEQLPGTAATRIGRRAAEDAARLGYIESVAGAIQEETPEAAAARQRYGAAAGAVLGGGLQAAGEVTSRGLARLAERAAARNLPPEPVVAPQRLPAPRPAAPERPVEEPFELLGRLREEPIEAPRALVPREQALQDLERVAANPLPGALTPFDTERVIAARALAAQAPETITIDTPEREALREQIAEGLYGAGAARQERQAWIALGPPAAGKSSRLVVPLASEQGALVIDADLAKPQLEPEYGEFGSGPVHKESSNIVEERLLSRAAIAGDNVVLALVGKNPTKVAAVVDGLTEAGYTVHLRLVDLPAREAARRAVERLYDPEGRFVDPDYVLNQVGDNPARTYETLKNDPRIATFERYSNDVPRGEPLRSIESGSNAPGRRVPGGVDLTGLAEGQQPPAIAATPTPGAPTAPAVAALRAPAIQLPDGTVVPGEPGELHIDISRRLQQEGVPWGAEEILAGRGFITEDNQFVDPFTASEMVEGRGEVGPRGLEAEQLRVAQEAAVEGLPRTAGIEAIAPGPPAIPAYTPPGIPGSIPAGPEVPGVPGIEGRAAPAEVRTGEEWQPPLYRLPADPTEFVRPVGVVRMDISDIARDPERFQFKQLGAEGVGSEIQSATHWNKDVAGVLSVWRDPADGLVYVVNGHNRHWLGEWARSQGQEVPPVNVQFIDAATAEEARAAGAFMNITENRGTPEDVAKFMRDMGQSIADLKAVGVPIGGQLARKGVALSRLAPDIFDAVARGETPQRFGVAIGEILGDADPAIQRQAFAAVRGSRLTEAEVREVARQVGAAGTEVVEEQTLFGTEGFTESLYVPRGQVAASLKRQLAKDKRLFGYITKGSRAEELASAGTTTIDVEAAQQRAEASATAEEVFDRLYTRAGPVAQAVTSAARRVLNGERVQDVVADVYPAVTAAIGQELAALGPVGGISPGPEAPGVVPAGEGREGRAPTGAVAAPTPSGPLGMPLRQEDIFGEPVLSEAEQTELLGGREGTRGARSLRQAEAAARSELETLRERFRLEQDPTRRQALADQIAVREKLVNRAERITPGEMARRAAAEGLSPRVPTNEELFSPLDPVDATEVRADELGMNPPAGVDAEGMPIGYRLRGQVATPAEWKRGESINRPQVMQSLAKIAEAAGKVIPIRAGRVAQRTVAGVFKVRPEVIRIRSADNLATAAHEIGHATEKLVFGWEKGGPWKQPRASKQMQQELTALGRELYGSSKPAAGYKREGFAEFWRRWLEEDPTLQQVAPAFSAWFEGEFLAGHPKIRAAADAARERMGVWRQQGARERARMSIADPGAPTARLQRVGQAIRRGASMEQLIEMAQPLYEMAAEAELQLGRELKPSENPYTSVAALRTVHAARTKQMVERGMIDLAGNHVGPALNDIRGLVKGQQEDFTAYLYGRRAIKLWTDPVRARDPGISLQDARQLVEELESPRFQLAAQKVYDWSAAVLDYAAEASPTFAAVVDRVRERDPGDYIPLRRVFEELDDLWARSAGRAAGTRSPVQRLRGSGRRIVDPFPQLIAQTEQTLRAAHARMVVDQILKLSQIEGMGHLIEEVPIPDVPVAAATIGDLIDRINTELVTRDPQGRLLTVEGGEEGLDADLLGKAITFFAPAHRPTGADPVVPVYEEGRVRWFRVDGRLYDTLGTLDVYRLPNVAGMPILEWGLGKPAAAFRAGTTGLRASFGLLWNPMRDVQTLWMNSAASANGAKLLWYWLRGMTDAALSRGLRQEASPFFEAALRLGVEMAQPLGQDIPHARIAARRLFQGRVVKAIDPHNWFEWYRDIVQAPEMAPRAAELRAVAEDVGWEPGQPMTLDQSLQLLLAAKQVTTDFTAAGEFARMVNRMVPFHNAAIQGPRANIRAARRNPAKFAWRGLQLTAATIGLWWLIKDEEWYKETNPREKFLHWHFPTEWPEKTLVRMPRAFEVGLVFGALPEALIDGWYRQDPEGVTEWLNVFRKASMPNMMPVLPGVVAEQLANQEFYFDRPIVPRSELQRPAEEQFNEYTSRIAITMGRIFNVSPRRIDHAVQGVFGYVAGDILDVVGLGVPEQPKEKEAADVPILGRLFQRGGQLGTRPKSFDEIYQALEQARQTQYSIRQPETELERQRRLLLTDATQAISALLYVRRFTEPSEQRQALTREALSIAQDALKRAKEPAIEREPFRMLRREAQQRRDVVRDSVTHRQNRDWGLFPPPTRRPRPPQPPRP
jgi:hypothetical protein